MVTKVGSKFDELYKLDVNKFKKKKGKFDYLSWSIAWKLFKGFYPEATFMVREWDGIPWLTTAQGTVVETIVTVEGIQQAEVFAVTDNYNNAIKEPDVTDIMNSKQRCLVKNLALFGLGLYIYEGEDLPQDGTEEPKPTPKPQPKKKPKGTGSSADVYARIKTKILDMTLIEELDAFIDDAAVVKALTGMNPKDSAEIGELYDERRNSMMEGFGDDK